MSDGGLWSEAGRRLRTNRAAVVAGAVEGLGVLAVPAVVIVAVGVDESNSRQRW